MKPADPDLGLVISIKDARKLLANDKLSDDEIRKLIMDIDELAGMLIDMYKVQKSKEAIAPRTFPEDNRLKRVIN